MTLITEGKFLVENAKKLNIEKERLDDILSDKNLSEKEIVLCTIENGNLFVQPKKSKYITIQTEL